MKRLPDQKTCVGCGVCITVCPATCLSFQRDQGGFCQIIGDVDKCIQCGKCERLCPVLNDRHNDDSFKQSDIKVYACRHKVNKIQKRSSSGGFFVALCTSLFSIYGDKLTVYGATLSSNLSVKHIEISSLSDISRLIGSKYLQSDITSVFLPIKQKLQKGEVILFSGTPCQIAALNCFLDKSFPTLFTCEVVCHGVPSSLHFEKQNEYFSQRHGGDVIDIQFRSKFISWTIPTTRYVFSNKKIKYFRMEENNFMYSFYGGLNLRASCYNCKYSSIPRQADITMGDFWGISKKSHFSLFERERGLSLVLCNTKKGVELFKSTQHWLDSEQRTINEAIQGNIHLIRPAEEESQTRDNLIADLESFSIEELSCKYERISTKKKWGLIMGHRCIRWYYYIKEILSI